MNNLLKEVDCLIAEHSYMKALEIIIKEIKSGKDIDNFKLWQKKSNIDYHLGKYDDCIYSSTKAIELNCNNRWIYARKGLALFKLDKYNDAKFYLEKAIKQGLNHSEVLFCYGLCCHRLDMIDISRKFLKKAVDLNRDILFRDWNIDKPQHSVKSILKNRLYQWIELKNPKFSRIVSLLGKDSVKGYIKDKKLLYPKTLMIRSNVSDLKMSDLPDRFVVKPEKGYGSHGVLVVEHGIELFNLIKLPYRLGDFIEKNVLRYSTDNSNEIIFEELIQDVDYVSNPYLKIPRDFKVFAAGGKVFWITVCNRNAREGLRSLVEYNAQWERLPRMSTALLHGVTEPKPKFFEDLIRQAEMISEDFPYVMRLDFYISDRGVMFGEFTPNPNAGYNLTEIGEKVLQQLFFIYPDSYE